MSEQDISFLEAGTITGKHEEFSSPLERRADNVGYAESPNVTPLNIMQSLKGMLTEEEELTFMNILFSSSATIRAGNFGLSRSNCGFQNKMRNFFHFYKESIRQ